MEHGRGFQQHRPGSIVGFVALLALIAVGQPLLIVRLHDQSLSYLALAVVLLAYSRSQQHSSSPGLSEIGPPGACRPRPHRFAGDARRLTARAAADRLGSARLVRDAWNPTWC
jgi:hypothetical protein